MLHVVQSGDRGGVQRHVRDVALGLRARTAGVVVGQEGWLTAQLREAGIPVVLAPSLRRAVDPMASARAAREVRQAAEATGAGVLHAHGIFALLACRHPGGRPLVYTPHGFQWRDPAHPPWLRAASRVVHRGLGPRLAALVAVSGRDAMDAAGLGVPLERVHHVPNGVPPARGPEAPAHRFPPALGVATRLVPGKGLKEAIRLLARLQGGVELHVAGTGPLEADLRRLALRVGVSTRVRWLGWQDDLEPFYRRIAVYVTLSRKEGLPYAVLDALAQGVPVLASDIPGHAEILAGGAAGFLVRRRAWEDAAARAHTWLYDTQAWQDASRAARREALQRFALAQMLQRLAALYAAEGG